ncbi:hypothetical protein KKF25_02170, partial [Patescibacteria group bacterium]|nr:hypothetical protein [Patescibacteria group bacterium]
MPKISLKINFILPCLGVLILFALPLVTIAAAYQPEIQLPGAPAAVSDPGAYIRYLFIFGLSLAGFLAVGAIALGG